MAALIQGPTIEQQAALLRRNGDEAWTPLVRIQPEGDREPFFCVHPVGGKHDAVYEVGPRNGKPAPLLRIAIPRGRRREAAGKRGGDGDREAIRGVQPHGPYHLGGWSMGGVVAYEMARRLARAGEKTALLALV